MGKKQEVIAEIYEICRKRGDYLFDNILVKDISRKHGFANPFDATKFDNIAKLPENLKNDDYYIAHIGEGRHKFMKGISNAYHEFEIIEKDECREWSYRKSILNELDSSEANVLSVAYNQRVIHDFLYNDIVANPKLYSARRTKTSFSYNINGKQIQTHRIQMEIDMTMELNGTITIFEAKNGDPGDFAVYQLFHPFKYYTNLKKNGIIDFKQITCCYVLRHKVKKNSVLRLYNYTFTDDNELSSTSLIKKAQYVLIQR